MIRRISFCLTLFLLMAPGNCLADGFTLEGGFVLGPSFPANKHEDKNFAELGITGQAGYEGRNWGVGVRGLNSISTNTALHIHAGAYDLSGGLSRRLIGTEIFGRLFLDNWDTQRKRWYLEVDFAGLEIDFVHAQTVYTVPESQDYTRIFLRGNGFSLGAGYRPRSGPWFYQFNYRLKRYETLLVEGQVDSLHQTVAQAPVDGFYFVHTFLLMVGLDVLGR